MNWTGGSRARNNKSSSSITRLQKRYFAKVRAQNSAPLAYIDSSSNLANNNVSKRKKARIPDFDIIVPNNSTHIEIPSKKRKLFSTSEDLTHSGAIRARTLESSTQPLGSRNREGNGLKTKKQLLLEKDNWVCTTLSRPLVLKNQDEGLRGVKMCPETRRNVSGSSSHHEISPGCDNPSKDLGVYVGKPQALNYSRYSSLERRSVDHMRGDRDRRRKGSGNGAFQNFSDGGYVKIGGNTQSRNNTLEKEEPLRREMSHISEDTMLLDLESRPEGYDPSIKSHIIPIRNSHVPENNHETTHMWKNLKNPIYNLNEWNANRDSHVNRGFLLSPLAPYSQNINNRGSIDSFSCTSSQPVSKIIEEIDAAVLETSSSPSAILSTIYVRPESVHSHERHQTHFENTVIGQKRNDGLNRLLEENVENTQNQSLIAYASSLESSSTRDEGEDWILGSDIPQKSCQMIESTPTNECEDDWQRFLKEHTMKGDKLIDTQRNIKDINVQKHLEEMGIWERCIEPVDLEVNRDDDRGEEKLIEDHKTHEEKCDDNSDWLEYPIGRLNMDNMANKTKLSIPETANSILWPDKGDIKASWGDFFINSPKGSGDMNHTRESKSIPLRLNTLENFCGATITNEEPSKEEPELVDPRTGDNVSKNFLELDKDEDSAWRDFVFGGFGEEESFKLPKPLKKTSRPSKLPLKLPSRVYASPEPELPNPPIHRSPIQDLYAPSIAGATMGSGSVSSLETNFSATDNSPTQKRSKFFNLNTVSSPLASPVSVVPTRPYKLKNMVPIGWRGESNLYSTRKKGIMKDKTVQKDTKQGEEVNKYLEDDIEDIEEW